MERVTVIVATYGSEEWHRAGHFKASEIAEARSRVRPEVRHVHERTLAEARNLGAYEAGPGWLCFVDADDYLEPSSYFDALLNGAGDLRAPALKLGDTFIDLTDRDIDTINPCVIGTLIRRDMFLDAGGFWHERAWEDWSLFRRAWLLGAEVVHHPEAVYHAADRPDSRNHTVDRPAELHASIRAAHSAWKASR